MFTLLALLGILVMIAALVLIPLGVPGTWIMVGVLGVGALAGEVGLMVLITAVVLAGIAELVEFAASARMNRRYGGSRGAFWGAVLGGICGVIIGLPVPVIGSVVAGFIGSFLGAAAATMFESNDYQRSFDVGRGAVLGRILSAAIKTGVGIVILVMGAAALLAP
jgi:uncharacterized protein